MTEAEKMIWAAAFASRPVDGKPRITDMMEYAADAVEDFRAVARFWDHWHSEPAVELPGFSEAEISMYEEMAGIKLKRYPAAK